jgi:hypothetical protein
MSPSFKLCKPFRKADLIQQDMADELAMIPDFHPDLSWLGPGETSLHPEAAVKIRHQVLMRTYADDYCVDNLDTCVSTLNIERDSEFIWFWGGKDQISKLRCLFQETSGVITDLDIGTVTVHDAYEEFGPGYGQLCRAASMDRTLGAKAPILWRTIGYLNGREKALHERYHSLILFSRNRPSSPNVRGGEAVQHIYSQHVARH